MFTGIITDLGRVRAVERGNETRFEIATSYDTASIAPGASIACSGPCLTVIDKGEGWFAVEASAETLSRTTLGAWREGVAVNLERSLKLGDEVGGHIVFGHVDGTVTLARQTASGDSVVFDFDAPASLLAYLAPKGSVALDGVSLTVNAVETDAFSVNIIPHTLRNTTFGAAKTGDRLNLEIDMLARYVARSLDKGETPLS
ncbi:MAG: riboflavin synthase [Alphaproteobacteria bacterium]|nr:riboflavin synthase [Alphaproteobacteria bacterium]